MRAATLLFVTPGFTTRSHVNYCFPLKEMLLNCQLFLYYRYLQAALQTICRGTVTYTKKYFEKRFRSVKLGSDVWKYMERSDGWYTLKGHCHRLTCAEAFTLADLKNFSLWDKYVYGFLAMFSCIPLCHHTFFSVPSCCFSHRVWSTLVDAILKMQALTWKHQTNFFKFCIGYSHMSTPNSVALRGLSQGIWKFTSSNSVRKTWIINSESKVQLTWMRHFGFSCWIC